MHQQDSLGGKKSGKAHIQVDALLKIPLQTNSITTHTNTLKFLFSLHTGTILPVCTLKLSTITFFTTQNKFLSQALAQSPHLHPPHSQAFLDLHKLTIWCTKCATWGNLGQDAWESFSFSFKMLNCIMYYYRRTSHISVHALYNNDNLCKFVISLF